MTLELCELFSKLTIHDTRQIKNNEDDVNIISQMMSKLNISVSDEMDDFINEIEQLTITDDEVIVEFKDHQIFKFRYTYFNCGDKIINVSNWTEAY
jgi:hypothetical protein